MANLIGEIAGEIWNYLNDSDNTPVSLANLSKKINRKKDQVVFGAGWLAGEGKISLEEKGATVKIALLK